MFQTFDQLKYKELTDHQIVVANGFLSTKLTGKWKIMSIINTTFYRKITPFTLKFL